MPSALPLCLTICINGVQYISIPARSHLEIIGPLPFMVSCPYTFSKSWGEPCSDIIVCDSPIHCVYTYSKPVAFLYGQNSPVFCVRVDSKRDRIYCVGNDNTIKVMAEKLVLIS